MISQTSREQLWRRTKREGSSLPVALVLGVLGYALPRLVSQTPMPSFTWTDFAVITAAYVAATAFVEHPEILRGTLPFRRQKTTASTLSIEVHDKVPVTTQVKAAASTCSVFVSFAAHTDLKATSELHARVTMALEAMGTLVTTLPIAQGMVVTSTFAAPDPVAHAVDAARRTQQVVLTSPVMRNVDPGIWLVSGSTEEYRNPQVVARVAEGVRREAHGAYAIFMVGHGIQEITSIAGVRLVRRSAIDVGAGASIEMAELRLVEKSA